MISRVRKIACEPYQAVFVLRQMGAFVGHVTGAVNTSNVFLIALLVSLQDKVRMKVLTVIVYCKLSVIIIRLLTRSTESPYPNGLSIEEKIEIV